MQTSGKENSKLVRIKTWDDLVKSGEEYQNRIIPPTTYDYAFIEEMKYLCGKSVNISFIGHFWRVSKLPGSEDWIIEDWMIDEKAYVYELINDYYEDRG